MAEKEAIFGFRDEISPKISIAFSGNAEFAHAGIQGRGIHLQQFRRALFALDSAPGRLEDELDVLALKLLKGFRLLADWKAGSQPLQLKRVPGADDQRMLDHVAQFADVARPGICLQGMHVAAGDPAHLLAHPFAEFADKLPHQLGNVLLALPERGYDDGKDVEAIIEVATEAAVLDLFLQISVRGRDQADIDLDGLRTAETFKFTILQDAEQFRLGLQGHLGNFIEKERGAVGQFKRLCS